MTIGIYALWWESHDIVYVGQSIKVERRYKDHIYKLENRLSSKNLNEAYLLYGIPTLVLLEECTIPELDTKEIEWINQFDSINTSAGGSRGSFGYNSGKCAASKEDCEYVLELLADTTLTLKDIADKTKVSIRTVESIAYKKRHFWLSELYPEKYAIATNNKRFSIAQERRFNTSVVLVSPEGVEYLVNNLSKFAKEHNLNKGHLCAVARGAELSHKNWRRKGGQ